MVFIQKQKTSLIGTTLVFSISNQHRLVTDTGKPRDTCISLKIKHSDKLALLIHKTNMHVMTETHAYLSEAGAAPCRMQQ